MSVLFISLKMSMNETRSPTSIFQFPTEIFHLIFDYLDPRTIFQSIAPVCEYFDEKVNSYNRLKLRLYAIRQSQWKFLGQRIPPSNVRYISLSVNDKVNPSNVNLFFSLFEFDRFVRLKSLELIQIDGSQLDLFFEHIVQYQLKSLSIILSSNQIDQIHQIIKQISSMIEQNGLESLYLTTFKRNVLSKTLLEPIEIILKRLNITDCTVEEYHLILSSCVNLKTLLIDNLICPTEFERISLPYVYSTYLQLTSLMLKSSSLEFDQLSSIVSLTPSLVYLEVNIEKCQSVEIFSGHSWKEFLLNRLSSLKIFEFSFVYQIQSNDNVSSIQTVIQSFQNSFWFNEKHSMIICDYVLRLAVINLYTESFVINDDQLVIRSTSSNIHLQLIQRNPSNSFSNEQVREFLSSLLLLLLFSILGDDIGSFSDISQ